MLKLHEIKAIRAPSEAIKITLSTSFYLADNGYIEGKELDDFFRHMMKRLGPQVSHT